MNRRPQHDPSIDMHEHAEPEEHTNPVPWLFWITVLSLTVWGASYFWLEMYLPAQGGGVSTVAQSRAAVAPGPDGAQIFASRCAACHQATGSGLPGMFPPLAGSEWVNGDAHKLADILLLGIEGALSVKGENFNGTMPTFGATLSDAEMAAVGNYVRSSFGNHAPEFDTSLVKAERDRLGNRSTPWKGDAELKPAQ
ncbi:c-type cytochrome [Paraburkholderia tagetis]|uniref:Cytochrome c n=1 Tax=Paraburkholderia tagetis TaxID=2913261 RepID=A0A9X1UMJ4_9BURK|nr:cytochrome c [Paraburkholderia tagetis]MCG5078150.1 cytochrome c [Paraburkholderia tagetis]